MTDLKDGDDGNAKTCDAHWPGIEPLSCCLPTKHDGPHHDDVYSWWRVQDGALQAYGPIQYNRAVRARCDDPPDKMLASLMGRK